MTFIAPTQGVIELLKLRLVPSSTEPDTIDALEALLRKARRGQVCGVCLSYMEPGGAEDAICTGVYRARPAEAVRAAMRVSMLLTRLEQTLRGPP